MLNKTLYFFVALVVIVGVVRLFWPAHHEQLVACDTDSLQCSDGSVVSRTGPACEFTCPDVPAPTDGSTVPADVAAQIAAKADLITLSNPAANGVVSSPLVVEGMARGTWFFEASFPIQLTNWDGLIIAEGVATASGDWMTEEFVPFTATLTFTNPYPVGAEDFMKKGTLILKKDNPSGMPEKDDALEIPVRFAP